MIEKQNIDELFKKGLTGVQVEPSPEVWEGVESRFFGRSKLIVWYLVGAAALLLMMMGGGYWYLGAGADTSTDLMNNEMAISALESENNMDGKTTTDFPSNETSTAESKSVSTEKEATANDNHLTTETSSSKTGNAESNPDEQVKEYLNEFNKSELQLPKTSGAGPAKNDIVESAILSTGKNINENITLSDQTVLLSDRPDQSIYSIFPLQINLVFEENIQMINPDQKEITGMNDFLEKQKKNHVYTAASATVGMIYYPSTKDQLTWSADLAVGMTAGRFYFETGAGYAQMNEEGTYLIDLQSYDSVGYYNQVESFEVNPQSPNEIIYNTKKVTVYDSIDHFTNTSPLFKYNYVNIPALIGYKFYSKDKFTVSAETGLLFSFMISKEIPEAQFENPDYTVVSTKNVTPERVNWNMRWQLGIRFNYQLRKSLSISAEPVFTKYLNSIYDTKQGYKNVKPYTMGVKFGLYFGF